MYQARESDVKQNGRGQPEQMGAVRAQVQAGGWRGKEHATLLSVFASLMLSQQ